MLPVLKLGTGRRKLSCKKHNLTPCGRVLLEKPIVDQLVKKFLAPYGTPMFITMFTTTRHWTLSFVKVR
jgi:hypothetical protein